MSDLPVVCTLGPAALKTRREGLLSNLARRAVRRQERPDGMILCFDAGQDIVPLIGSVIDAERQCCRFLRFQLTVEPDEHGMSLELTGPPGTREFLTALLEG